MTTLAKVLKTVFVAAIAYEGTIQIHEIAERYKYYRLARQYCDETGKLLLRIGVRRSPLEPPNGDVTLDIDPVITNIPGGVLGDERNMPFGDKQFGVCFNEHTLEHLYNIEDVEIAINECVRVADYTILLAPSPYSIYASLFCPTHYLRLWFSNGKIRVVPNTYRTGLGFVNPPAIQQVMVLKDEPPVIEGRRFILSHSSIESIG